MCNFYSLTKGKAAIREFIRAMVDQTDNLPPMPGGDVLAFLDENPDVRTIIVAKEQ